MTSRAGLPHWLSASKEELIPATRCIFIPILQMDREHCGRGLASLPVHGFPFVRLPIIRLYGRACYYPIRQPVRLCEPSHIACAICFLVIMSDWLVLLPPAPGRGIYHRAKWEPERKEEVQSAHCGGEPFRLKLKGHQRAELPSQGRPVLSHCPCTLQPDFDLGVSKEWDFPSSFLGGVEDAGKREGAMKMWGAPSLHPMVTILL